MSDFSFCAYLFKNFNLTHTKNLFPYSHTMEDDSALKRKEILTHATTWMKLDTMMLSDTSQIQKTSTV